MDELTNTNEPVVDEPILDENGMEIVAEIAPLPSRDEFLRTLAGEIESKFKTRQGRRQVKEQQWLEAESMYLGSAAVTTPTASPDKPFTAERTNSRPPSFNLIGTKCDSAISILWAKQFAGGDKNWDIGPSPAPEVSLNQPLPYPDAVAAADAMEVVIDDQLSKGRYGYQCRLAMRDKVVLGTGIIKSPVNAGKSLTSYTRTDIDGQAVFLPQVSQKDYPCARRINPWFFFPDETATTIEQATDAIVLHPMAAVELERLKLDPSFFGEVIDEVLKETPPSNDNGDSYYNFTKISDSGSEALRDRYKVMEYHGPITQDQMGNIGLSASYETPNSVYYAEIWAVSNRVIRAELSNIEGAQAIPFAVCTWKDDPSSIFGIGLATQLSDAQRVIRVTYEMILDNAAISSGSQLVIDKTKITPANGQWEMKPQKIWYNNEYDTDVTKAFFEFQPQNVTPPLMNLLQMVQGFAQEEAAVPFFMPGTQSAVAADTAHGTKQIMDQSTTVIDYYNEKWDDTITVKVISGMYAWNMQYHPDPTIKGDFEIDVRSSSDERSAQIHLADLEKLAILASQDPDTAPFVDKKQLTKARLRAMRLSDKSIIKTEQQMQADAEAAAQAAAEQGPSPEEMQMQIEQQLAAVKEREIALKEQESKMKMEREMQKEAWDHEERMAAQYARLREAEAQVLAAQATRETEMYKLAMASEQHREKIMADINKAQLADSTTRFLAGIDATKEFRKQALVEAELSLKARTGSGI